ncbi:hypothetical protein [Cellulomonas cellasea]|uniref:hypothetical protein n=1 Tax=Cellulomonas cellasea TaxID=43670 RepID=UPI0025A4CA13|nr:hypothetical protein [Cellulomonas cellasea]
MASMASGVSGQASTTGSENVSPARAMYDPVSSVDTSTAQSSPTMQVARIAPSSA